MFTPDIALIILVLPAQLLYHKCVTFVHEFFLNFRVQSTLQNNQRGSLKPEDSSSTTKQQHDDSILKVTPTETERPMMRECIFQSQQLPMWNTDNYSTDLDYEPYEDEDNGSFHNVI